MLHSVPVPGTSPSPLVFAHTGTLWVFAGQGFSASPWMSLYRESTHDQDVATLFAQSLIGTRTDERSELLDRVFRHFFPAEYINTRERWHRWWDDAGDVVHTDLVRGRLKVFKLAAHYRAHLLNPNSYVWRSVTSSGSGVSAHDALRNQIAGELASLIAPRWVARDRANSALMDNPWLLRRIYESEAIGRGVVSTVATLWDGVVELLALLGKAVTITYRLVNHTLKASVTYTHDVLEAGVEKVAHDIARLTGAALHGARDAKALARQVKTLIAKGVALLNRVFSDAVLRDAFVAFFDSLNESRGHLQRLEFATAVTGTIGVEVALFLATAGSSGAALAARTGARAGPFSQRLLELMARFARAPHGSAGGGASTATRAGAGAISSAARSVTPASRTRGRAPVRSTTASTQPRTPASTDGPDTDTLTPARSPNGTPSCSLADTVTAGCPVSVSSGEEILQYDDVSLPGPLPLRWTRTYRSGNDTDVGLGVGWSHGYGVTLRVQDHSIEYIDAEARLITFAALEQPGASSRHRSEGLTLTCDSNERYTLVHREGLRYVFEGAGTVKRLVALHDRNHNRATLHYDEHGHMMRIERSSGAGLRIERDANGRIIALRPINIPPTSSSRSSSASNPMWNNTPSATPACRYTYSDDGDLTRVRDALGHGERFTYAHHLLTTRTLASGFVFHYTWSGTDKHARCTRTYGEDGTYDVTFAYDTERRITTLMDGRRAKRVYHYDANARIVREVDAQGGVHLTQWSASGQVTQTVAPDGARTRYTYDANDCLSAITDATGATHTLVHDANGMPVRLTDPLGHVWGRHYDARGNLVQATDALDQVTRYRYDERGLPETITDAMGGQLRLTWNSAGQLVQRLAPNGVSTHYTYNAEGLVATSRTGDAPPAVYDYDATGRLTSATTASGDTTWYAYDSAGRLTRIIDAAGGKTEYRYAGLAQVIERIEPDGSRFHYEYDVERNLTALINQNGERYTLAYDANERLIREVGFDGRTQHYHYNDAGHLVAHEDAPGLDGDARITAFKRDPLGRLLEKHSTDGETSTFAYDPAGRLIEAHNAARQLTFQYDALGCLTQERQDTHKLTHRYDALGRRVESTLPDAQTLRFYYDEHGYDEAGALSRITCNGDVVAEIERDALGRTTRTRQGALDTHYDYDLSQRLKRQHTHRSTDLTSAHPLVDRRYRYDATGNLTHIETLKGVTHFSYDPLERITAVIGATPETFAFDPAGNLLDAQNAQNAASGGYVKGNRLVMHGDAKFDYDPAGNLIREERGKDGKLTTEYRYNHQNQLKEVLKAGDHITFNYDALGRRTTKTSRAGVTTYLWNGDQLLSENKNGAVRTYIHAPGSFIPLATIEHDQLYHYLVDHIGTPHSVADDNGEFVWHADYLLYGKVTHVDIDELENNIRFQGQYFDNETGLHYNRFRYYHPATGRFINQDPVGLVGGVNLYQYAPNPTGWTDPLGLTPEPDDCPKSIGQRLRDAGPGTEYGLPGGKNRSGPFRFRPDKGYNPSQSLPRGEHGGYLDRFDNEWVRGPYHGDPLKDFEFEWDVRLSAIGERHWNKFGDAMRRNDDGGLYINVAPDGTLSH